MSVGEITEMSSEILIERLQDIPYGADERIMDILVSSLEFLKDVFMAPYHLWSSIENFNDFLLNRALSIDPSTLLTLETISKVVEKHFAGNEKKVQICEKLSYISSKVQEYAQKLNLGQVNLHFEPSTKKDFLAAACRGITKQFLFVGHEIVEYSAEEIDWLLAHELMHIKNYDSLKDIGFLFSRLLLYVFFSGSLPWFYSIPLILLTDGVASLFFKALKRRCEKKADEGALDFLQTHTGMVKFVSAKLRQNLVIKYLSIEQSKKIYPDLSPETIENGKIVITHMGNNRFNFTHPSATERLAVALAFVPQAQIPQES